ncbi:hypothetical protein PIB30_001611 [Stylosanthes scabra]|uniref:Uncharacterized protein n=1 Tax=Stylosanthes scabra TaxID=79078 RepID=A0ABU6S2B2_9FABA|nr:hypothetical protein [Stylosanthes scabra]
MSDERKHDRVRFLFLDSVLGEPLCYVKSIISFCELKRFGWREPSPLLSLTPPPPTFRHQRCGETPKPALTPSRLPSPPSLRTCRLQCCVVVVQTPAKIYAASIRLLPPQAVARVANSTIEVSRIIIIIEFATSGQTARTCLGLA